MPSIGEATNRVVGAQLRTPKTILGFFAIVLGIVAGGAAAVTAILVRTELLHHLIIPVLLFAGGLVVVVLVAVFVTAWKDPTILMLGEITGQAYIENRRLSLGDSIQGERIQEVSSVGPSTGVTRALPTVSRGSEQGE